MFSTVVYFVSKNSSLTDVSSANTSCGSSISAKEYHRVTHTNLLTSGRLNDYLADIDKQARERLETLTQQIKQAQGITEWLKTDNQMEWAGRILCCFFFLGVFFNDVCSLDGGDAMST